MRCNARGSTCITKYPFSQSSLSCKAGYFLHFLQTPLSTSPPKQKPLSQDSEWWPLSLSSCNIVLELWDHKIRHKNKIRSLYVQKQLAIVLSFADDIITNLESSRELTERFENNKIIQWVIKFISKRKLISYNPICFLGNQNNTS